jgi:hypothetical protein
MITFRGDARPMVFQRLAISSQKYKYSFFVTEGLMFKTVQGLEVWRTYLHTMGTATLAVGEVDTASAAEVRAIVNRSMSTSGGENQPIDGIG